MNRFDRSFLTCAGLIFLFLPTGCSGGGGGGSSSASGSSSMLLPPGATPTPFSGYSGGSTSLADCTTSQNVQAAARHALSVPMTPAPVTAYNLTSYPSGATVTNNGASIGTTPVSFTPTSTSAGALGGVANLLAFTAGSTNFTVCVSQAGFSSRNIFFNSAGYTTGSIGTVATSSVAKNAQSVASSELSGSSTLSAATLNRHDLRYASNESTNSNEILVKYKSQALQSSNRSISSIEQSMGMTSARTLGPQDGSVISRVVRVPQGRSAATLMASLANDPAVDSVSPVHYRSSLALLPVTPNDPSFTKDQSHQWDLYQIQAPNAWAISQGSSSIAVAIIDTGYDPNNQDLIGKVTYAESVINGTVTTGSAAVQDTDGHGTNVSGIASADTNNGLAVAGTGYNVSLQEYRIFPNPSDPGYSPVGSGASSSDEAQAIYDAVAHGAKVISLSLGGVESAGIDAGEYDAVEYAIAHNVTVAAAAGNERLSGVNTVDYPAAYPGVIAVGASALNDSAAPNVRTSATEYVAPYSNAGPGLALVAPGGDPANTSDTDFLHWILNLDTTQPATGKTCTGGPSNCLALFAGTSQATPHVSAAAALIYSINANLTPAAVKSILMNNADNINDARQGAGRLNLYRALAAVSGTTVGSAPTTPSNSNFVAFAYTNSGGTTPTIVDLTFTGGVPVSTNGTFTLADINNTAMSYKVGVWADVNGNGIIDAGDYFGASTGTCSGTAPCSAASGITVAPVPSGFTLP